MLTTVLEVTDVNLSLIKTYPPQLLIVACGTVPSSGWTDPQLVPYIYKKPPEDGIYDFSFCANAPEGPVTRPIETITAEHTLTQIPEGFRGVRIHASTNAMVAILGETSASGQICVKGTLTDEGVECQALRGTDGKLYTLLGDLKGFKIGDEVIVCGTVADISICMQGTTIVISWIGKEAPRAL